jgi:hypothetical protein
VPTHDGFGRDHNVGLLPSRSKSTNGDPEARRAGLILAADADASVRRVVDVVRDSPAGDSDARARDESAFRGTDRKIETWLGVITEHWREGGYVIDFKVGQSFGESQSQIEILLTGSL